mmetsp:Transcript_38188/g.53017  ORF Transcript_38188/g.53017 Transcript_38188/m.53017 type:complete len:105 (-) Transcript_38188:213-527(-)
MNREMARMAEAQETTREKLAVVAEELEPLGDQVMGMADQMGMNIMNYRGNLDQEITELRYEIRNKDKHLSEDLKIFSTSIEQDLEGLTGSLNQRAVKSSGCLIA